MCSGFRTPRIDANCWNAASRSRRMQFWSIGTSPHGRGLFGAELSFDHTVRMQYRQYDANTARVRLPFWPDQILSDSVLVRKHFQLVLASGGQEHFLPGRWAELLRAARDIEQFERYINQSPANLNAYLDSLNRAVKQPIWWTSVAYSPLWRTCGNRKRPYANSEVGQHGSRPRPSAVHHCGGWIQS